MNLFFVILSTLALSISAQATVKFQYELGASINQSDYYEIDIQDSYVKSASLKCPGGRYYKQAGASGKRRGDTDITQIRLVCLKRGDL